MMVEPKKSTRCPVCLAMGNPNQRMVIRRLAPGARGQQITVWDNGGLSCTECGLTAPLNVVHLLEHVLSQRPVTTRATVDEHDTFLHDAMAQAVEWDGEARTEHVVHAAMSVLTDEAERVKAEVVTCAEDDVRGLLDKLKRLRKAGEGS